MWGAINLAFGSRPRLPQRAFQGVGEGVGGGEHLPLSHCAALHACLANRSMCIPYVELSSSTPSLPSSFLLGLQKAAIIPSSIHPSAFLRRCRDARDIRCGISKEVGSQHVYPEQMGFSLVRLFKHPRGVLAQSPRRYYMLQDPMLFVLWTCGGTSRVESAHGFFTTKRVRAG